MDGRLAVKRRRDDNPALTYGDAFRYNIYRQTHPFNAAVSCKKNCSSDANASETHSGKTTTFTGRNHQVVYTDETDCCGFLSLAEVYEKALNNVLNIQPNFKMDENHNKNTMAEKKPLAALDTPHFQPPGGCKQLHVSRKESHLSQHPINDDKKLNSTNKSAFHVPEKRRLSNSGQSRYGNWSHDHPYPYTVNYPGDYYNPIHPPAFYPRYDNLYLESCNYYPAPRRREFPVFTHVLPWLQFERDYKPMTSSPNKPMTSPRFTELCPKGTLGYDTRKDIKIDSAQNQIRPTPLNREDKSVGHKTGGNAGSNNLEYSRMRNDEKCNKSPDLSNVKTRRMRAVEKRHDLNTTSKKDSFGSPKEEFLFSLGLTRIDHEG